MCSLKNKTTKNGGKIKNKKKIKNQMEEIKEESNVLGYIVMKFNVVSLNSILNYI